MSERISVFEELDISEFGPKPAIEGAQQAPDKAEIRAVSEASNFRSREPLSLQPEPATATINSLGDDLRHTAQQSHQDPAVISPQVSSFSAPLPGITPRVALRREQRLHRTGRYAQLNVKSKPEIKDAFETLATVLDKSFAETFEFALAALTHFTGSNQINPETVVYLDKRLNDLKRFA